MVLDVTKPYSGLRPPSVMRTATGLDKNLGFGPCDSAPEGGFLVLGGYRRGTIVGELSLGDYPQREKNAQWEESFFHKRYGQSRALSMEWLGRCGFILVALDIAQPGFLCHNEIHIHAPTRRVLLK